MYRSTDLQPVSSQEAKLKFSVPDIILLSQVLLPEKVRTIPDWLIISLLSQTLSILIFLTQEGGGGGKRGEEGDSQGK